MKILYCLFHPVFDVLSLTLSDKGFSCFSSFSSSFASWSTMMFFIDSLNSDIRYFNIP